MRDFSRMYDVVRVLCAGFLFFAAVLFKLICHETFFLPVFLNRITILYHIYMHVSSHSRFMSPKRRIDNIWWTDFAILGVHRRNRTNIPHTTCHKVPPEFQIMDNVYFGLLLLQRATVHFERLFWCWNSGHGCSNIREIRPNQKLCSNQSNSSRSTAKSSLDSCGTFSDIFHRLHPVFIHTQSVRLRGWIGSEKIHLLREYVSYKHNDLESLYLDKTGAFQIRTGCDNSYFEYYNLVGIHAYNGKEENPQRTNCSPRQRLRKQRRIKVCYQI